LLTAQIDRPQPGLLLLQYPDNLFFVEPAALHASAPCLRRTLPKSGGDLGAQVTAKDGFVVLTRFDNKQIKDWAVAHVSMTGDYFYHRSEATFYQLQGALKRFCELTGQSYEEPFDDDC